MKKLTYIILAICVMMAVGCPSDSEMTDSISEAEAAVESHNTYTVTFEPNGGDGRAFSQSFRGGRMQPLMRCSFKRTGWTFSGGWAVEPDGEKVYRNNEQVILTKDLRLYAVWTAHKYTIKFDANGGSGDMEDLSMTYDVTKHLSPNEFTRAGYGFTGWNTASDGSGTSYANGSNVSNLTTENGGNVTLYAQWTGNRYKVRFNGNGYESGEMQDQNMVYGVASALTANGYTKTGYTFNSWNTAINGSGTAFADGASVSDLTDVNGDTVNLYAQWAAGWVDYTVKRYFQTVDGAAYAQDTANYPNLTNSGITDTETAETAVPITGFTAQPITQQTIAGDGSTVVNIYYNRDWITYTFSANGGKWSDSTTADKDVSGYYGAAVSVPVPEKTGYHYTWDSTVPTEFDENDGAEFTAQWTANSYTITYHSNYEDVTTQTVTMTYDGTGYFRAGFYRGGWSFVRWNTASDGTGTDYAADAAVPNLTAENGANIDLYALWYTATLAQVSIGDICYQNGASVIYSSNYLSDRTPIGIVYAKDTAVKIVHLSQSPTELAWCLSSADGYKCNPPTSTSDGSGNWQIICDAVSDEGTAGNYPAFEYVNGLGSGWYMPAQDELYAVYKNKTAINTGLTVLSNAGVSVTTLGTTSRYWSSSSDTDKFAWYQRFIDGFQNYNAKVNTFSVRAVRAF